VTFQETTSSFQSDGALISGESKTVSSRLRELAKFEKSASPVKWLNRLWSEKGRLLQPDKIAAATGSTTFNRLNMARHDAGKSRPKSSRRIAISTWIVIQPRAEPAFHFGNGFAFAPGQVFNLVLAEFANGEVF